MDFFIEHKSYFYSGWVILWLIISSVNLYVYSELENEEVDGLGSLWRPNGAALVLIFFTFWWSKGSRNEIKAAKLSNMLSITLGAYTLILMSLMYLTYDITP